MRWYPEPRRFKLNIERVRRHGLSWHFPLDECTSYTVERQQAAVDTQRASPWYHKNLSNWFYSQRHRLGFWIMWVDWSIAIGDVPSDHNVLSLYRQDAVGYDIKVYAVLIERNMFSDFCRGNMNIWSSVERYQYAEYSCFISGIWRELLLFLNRKEKQRPCRQIPWKCSQWNEWLYRIEQIERRKKSIISVYALWIEGKL